MLEGGFRDVLYSGWTEDGLVYCHYNGSVASSLSSNNEASGEVPIFKNVDLEPPQT